MLRLLFIFTKMNVKNERMCRESMEKEENNKNNGRNLPTRV